LRENLPRSTACARAVLGMLTYSDMRCASCAPAARNPPSLATVLTQPRGDQAFVGATEVATGIAKKRLD
jgi:hypothetical protein